KIAIDKINEALQMNESIQWLIYLQVPILLIIKLLLVTVCINMGVVLLRLDISFGKLFRVVLIAEAVFIAGNLLKIAWLGTLDVKVLEDIFYFYPLSMASLIEQTNIQNWYAYPLVTMNLFEVGFMILVAYLLAGKTTLIFTRSLILVVLTYGSGLFVWMVFIVYLSINFG
ncbi:MAG: hypothetical protein IH946_05410, partial [Bacteroidetes bacterium]|nr:hypothetical protein [Bacteroidota bacterium]